MPIIEDQLRQVKASVDARVAQVLALACTEATYKDVKKARAELNKEFQDLEARRREVKKAILAPYEAFEKLYKECAADAFTKADAELKAKIASVENGIKGAKRDEIVAFYNEYRAYCTQVGEYIRSTTDFYTAIELAGFEKKRTKTGVIVRGIRLKSDFLKS